MSAHVLTLSVLENRLAVCRLDPPEPGGELPAWTSASAFFSITRTADELSVVCDEEVVPNEIVSEIGWRCIMVHGPLEFSMVGVLASLTMPLAEAGISIFALSTYDTDYLLVKQDDLEATIEVLSGHGHSILSAGSRS